MDEAISIGSTVLAFGGLLVYIRFGNRRLKERDERLDALLGTFAQSILARLQSERLPLDGIVHVSAREDTQKLVTDMIEETWKVRGRDRAIGGKHFFPGRLNR